MGVPCPACGRESRVLIRGLCPSCFASRVGVARVPSRVEVRVCRYCGSVRIGSRWVRVSSFGEAVESIASYVVGRARPVDPLEGVELAGVDYETHPNWTTRLRLRLVGWYRGTPVPGVAELTVVLRPSVCPVCKVRVSGEYDTVLQVRGGDPGELERIIERVVVEAGLADQTVDLIRGRDGVDVYFTNTGAARKTARILANRLGGRIEGLTHETVGRTSRGRMRSRKTLVLRLDKE